MDFKTFFDTAWHDHATDPAAVARRLPDAVALVSDEPQLNQLMHLAQHVHGEHLGEWELGIAFVERLSASPAYVADGASGQARARSLASLRLARGEGAAADALDALDASNALSPSDRIRVLAMAAASLAERDTARAARLLQDALARAEASGLPATDPMNRALAVTGHNLACTLEEKPGRSADERALMILAAQTSRHHWGLIGTWLETERAEYRLANTWLQAGDLARARAHAQACVEIVAAHDGPALERLFGWEALGLVERAAGNTTGHAQALAHAREAFAALDESDKVWCASSVKKLAAVD